MDISGFRELEPIQGAPEGVARPHHRWIRVYDIPVLRHDELAERAARSAPSSSSWPVGPHR